MDFWAALMFFFLIFLVMTCCGYCCTTKRRGAILSTPVVVTSTTHTAPGAYPTQVAPPGGYQANVYAAPYPASVSTGGQVHMPMPMPMPATQPPMAGMNPHMAPYPPMQAASMNPPSYDVAVSGGPIGQLNTTGYEKQSPYNPNYAAQ